MVECSPAADQRNVLRARDKHIVAKRRDQSKPTDGVGLARDHFAQAKLSKRRASLRGDGAAAGLVARKIKAIDEDHSIHPELAEAHRSGEASGAGTDDAHLRMDNGATAGGTWLLPHPQSR